MEKIVFQLKSENFEFVNPLIK